MRWTAEILNARAAAEIAALPPDMYARLTRLIKIIEEYGPWRAAPGQCQASRRQAVGIARDRPGRHIARHLRDRKRSAGRDLAGIREEDSEDAGTRTRHRAAARERGQMMKFSTLHKRMMKDEAYRKEYDALEE